MPIQNSWNLPIGRPCRVRLLMFYIFNMNILYLVREYCLFCVFVFVLFFTQYYLYYSVGFMKTVTQINQRYIVGQSPSECSIYDVLVALPRNFNARWELTVNMVNRFNVDFLFMFWSYTGPGRLIANLCNW